MEGIKICSASPPCDPPSVAFAEIGQKFDALTPYALVFKEVDGERYRAVVDFD
jgi:hypothetical protein